MESNTKEDGLLEAICKGDRAALKKSYDSFGSGLMGWLYNFLKQRELAEEVLQEVFVKVWRKACDFDRSKAKPFTWIFTICRNTALDTVKSKGYKNTQIQDSLDSEENYFEPAVEQIKPESIDVREKVKNYLTEDQQKVIDLVYFQGYSQSEASEKLDIPLGTVKTRVRLAMNSLRKVYGIS